MAKFKKARLLVAYFAPSTAALWTLYSVRDLPHVMRAGLAAPGQSDAARDVARVERPDAAIGAMTFGFACATCRDTTFSGF